MDLTEFQATFAERFFSTKKHPPKKGQILAQYRAVAHFVDDWVKHNVLTMLKESPGGAETASTVLRNMCGVVEEDSVRVPLQMTEDLLGGMSDKEVLAKEYQMLVEYFFWAERQHVPEDDPHWFTIELLNSDAELDKICQSSIRVDA